MKPRLSVVLFLAVLVAVPICHGETLSGLKLDFSRRTVTLRVTIDDLQDAYRVGSDGSIRMQARPTTVNVSGREVVVEIAPAKRKTGVFRVRSDGQTSEVRVTADNRLTGPSRIGGLPLGYAFLPPGGRATEGQTWQEEYPAPADAGGARVSATFRYTLVGRAPSEGCADCVEIRIVGLRRFLPESLLGGMLASVLAGGDDEFFTTNQVFAVGTVLFSPKKGFFKRFELAMNVSMLTPVSVPGMMRRVVVERLGVER